MTILDFLNYYKDDIHKAMVAEGHVRFGFESKKLFVTNDYEWYRTAIKSNVDGFDGVSE